MNSYKIVLVGYYGYRNFGDDLLLLSTLKILNETGFEGEAFIPSPKGLDSVISEMPVSFKISQIPRYNPISLERAIQRSAITVFGGGNLFQDETSTRSFLYYYFIAKKTLSYGKKLLLLSQGFGPLKKGSNLKKLSKILSSTNTFAVLRDSVSFRFACNHSINAFGGTDYGPYCLRLSKNDAAEDKGLVILIPKHLNYATEILNTLKAKGFSKLCIIPFQNHREGMLLKRLNQIASSIGFLLTPPPRSNYEIADFFQRSSLIVSERLHGAILAMWLAKPFIWKQNKKMMDFFSSFEHTPPYFSTEAESINRAIDRSKSFDYKSLSSAYIQKLEKTIHLSKEVLEKIFEKRG
ncbi:MAG: polysaccharide pyruvyl transferase [Thermotogae bacterium]|uniref:polysaccharide pyruvyl transferase family protein n=1 Tax=Kosmotoga sp. TaxID=1955248 RepID=UPI000F180AFF|nr:polysaccharide pyruvyl transferase family protein [Kosmotoga sp.]MBO8165716.1 polysaccharide pyruvyl transferase family protein [Kosmotoga sp.]RKX50809.1 MAG: polysaccharide pyruvyl transferase [Thermotogota bacterium]